MTVIKIYYANFSNNIYIYLNIRDELNKNI